MTKSAHPAPSNPQRVLLIGARGLIGRAIHKQLESEPHRYEVVSLSRSTRPGLDLEDRPSIARTLAALAPFDHVVVAAGEADFVTVDALSESSFLLAIQSKLLGQVGVALAALPHLPPGGSITLTSGALSHSPTMGSTPAALVNGAIDSFVRAVAFELHDTRRINAISPGWITDTLLRFGMDPQGGSSAEEVAEMYVHALQSDLHGSVVTGVDSADVPSPTLTNPPPPMNPHRPVSSRPVDTR